MDSMSKFMKTEGVYSTKNSLSSRPEKKRTGRRKNIYM